MTSPHSGQDDVEFQRDVARIALAGIEPAGFALAGSGAIREYGLIDRLTEDIDLFTTIQNNDAFTDAVARVISELGKHDFNVVEVRRSDQFARLHVSSSLGAQLDIDMAVDWRETSPVILDVGPVLSLADAIGNKISALYSRSEPRDYLDVDAIRQSGKISDEDLIKAVGERDPGFEINMFVQQLDMASRITLEDVRRYGINTEQLTAMKERFQQWVRSFDRRNNHDTAG
jgi:hypothetical protein